MWLKYLLIILFFFFLALAQSSFLPYFNILGAVLNIIFVSFFLLNFFSFSNQRLSYNKKLTLSISEIFLAITAGFFLDVYFASFFGSSIISFLVISFFVKKSLQNLKETKEKYSVVYFIVLFLASFVFSELFLDLILYFSNHLYPASFSWIFLVKIIYNLLFATAVFYVFKKIFNKK
jgi:cell shape-determining protein MreD